MLEYENLVYSIVHKYGKNYDKEDLYQVGMMGLLEAKKNFNEDASVKFSTYAYYYVIGEITKYIRESKSIKLSKDIVKLNKSINKASDLLTQRLGRVPTTNELSKFLEVDETKIIEVINSTQDVQSLDYSYDEESNDLYNSIVCDRSKLRDDLIDLRDELKRLSPDEWKLIKERYYDDLSQTELSKMIGMSQVQISRKETKILKKLKERL